MLPTSAAATARVGTRTQVAWHVGYTASMLAPTAASHTHVEFMISSSTSVMTMLEWPWQTFAPDPHVGEPQVLWIDLCMDIQLGMLVAMSLTLVACCGALVAVGVLVLILDIAMAMLGATNRHRSTGTPTIMCACHAMHVEHDHQGHDHC